MDQIKDFAFIFLCFMSSDPIQSLIAQEKLSTIKRAIKIKDYNNRSVVFTKNQFALKMSKPKLPPHRPKPIKSLLSPQNILPENGKTLGMSGTLPAPQTKSNLTEWIFE